MMPLFFSRALFGLFDTVGIARHLTAEVQRTLSSTAIVFLSVPGDMPALEAGRLYYRRLLELASLGFATWPLSVLVDDPQAQRTFVEEFGLDGNRLIAALRVGLPNGEPAARARYSLQDIAFVEADS